MKKIAVIGTGLSALSLVHHLPALDITFFEKSWRPGGRITTRRHENYIFDHAGEGETSLLMALAPEGVEMARVSENTTWYTKSAANSSPEKGELVTLKIINSLIERLK